MYGTRWAFAVALFGSFAAGCGDEATGKSLLEDLGVPTNEAPRTDFKTFHPLQRRYGTFLKKSELYLSGAMMRAEPPFTGPYASYANRLQVLLDDAGAAVPYAPLFSAADEAWTYHEAASTAADADGDGIEEVVVVYHAPPKVFLRTIRRGSSGYEQSEPLDLGDFAFASETLEFDGLQLAAGDLDADGKDEIVAAIGGTVLVLDDAGTGFRLLASTSYHPGVAAQVTAVAVGNVDADPAVEIVVANGTYARDVGARWYVYDLAGGALVAKVDGEVLSESDVPGDVPRDYGFARVAIGDLDGDNLAEIAFAGNASDPQLSVTVAKYDPGSDRFQALTTARFPMQEQVRNHRVVPAVAVLNADGLERGSRKRELLAYRYVLRLDADGTLHHKYGSDLAPPLDIPHRGELTVGDLNGDGLDEVAYFPATMVTVPYPRGYLSIAGYHGGLFQEVDRLPVIQGDHNMTLCALNIDDDSLVLRYTGEYELLYTEPRIVAVLASPPYYAGQDTGDAGTTISWARSSELESAKAYGFYVGFSIGAEWEVPKVYKAKVYVTVDSSFDWTYTSVRSNAQSKSLTCPAGENQVIFAVTPHDVYYYEIVDAPDDAAIGKRYAIQMPRAPKIYPMELARFNLIVGEALRVPADVLRHRLGEPWSYPTRSDMNALFRRGTEVKVDPASGKTYHSVVPVSADLGGFATPDEFMLDIGGGAGGTQTIELSGGSSEGFGFDFNLQTGFEAEVTMGVLFVAGRAGFHYGYSQSFTTNESTSIRGTVPNLPVSMSHRRPYSVGLFSYPVAAAGGIPYVVVNYWVEE